MRKEDQVRRRRNAALERRIQQIIERYLNQNEFSFAVEGIFDRPLHEDIFQESCTVTIAGAAVEMTVADMLVLHEGAATACGLAGCLSRGNSTIREFSRDPLVAKEAIGFLRQTGLIR